jgi:hypothetical protein
VRNIASLLGDAAAVMTKSTAPVDTRDDIENILREKRPDADIQVVSNPEFLREGAARHNDRARKVLAAIYRPLYLNAPPIIYGSRRTAELIKNASIAFLASKIFINEDAPEQVWSFAQYRSTAHNCQKSLFWPKLRMRLRFAGRLRGQRGERIPPKVLSPGGEDGCLSRRRRNYWNITRIAL